MNNRSSHDDIDLIVTDSYCDLPVWEEIALTEETVHLIDALAEVRADILDYAEAWADWDTLRTGVEYDDLRFWKVAVPQAVLAVLADSEKRESISACIALLDHYGYDTVRR